MNEATLQSAGERAVIRLERRLPDPPPTVWRALVDPTELERWFPCAVIAPEWRVGASLRFEFRERELPAMTGTVLEVDEPRVLSYTWGDETLRFELEPDGDGTLLVLTDDLERAIAARNSAGWEDCLAHLAGTEMPSDWRTRFARYTASFEPQLGPQEGPPAGANV